MPDETTPVVSPPVIQAAPLTSPTGTPMLPPSVAPWAALAVVVAGALLMMFEPGSVGFKICSVVTAIGGALGIASPGWRK